MEGWLSPVEGTRLEIERGVKPTVGSNPTPSALTSIPRYERVSPAERVESRRFELQFDCWSRARVHASTRAAALISQSHASAWIISLLPPPPTRVWPTLWSGKDCRWHRQCL